MITDDISESIPNFTSSVYPDAPLSEESQANCNDCTPIGKKEIFFNRQKKCVKNGHFFKKLFVGSQKYCNGCGSIDKVNECFNRLKEGAEWGGFFNPLKFKASDNTRSYSLTGGTCSAMSCNFACKYLGLKEDLKNAGELNREHLLEQVVLYRHAGTLISFRGLR